MHFAPQLGFWLMIRNDRVEDTQRAGAGPKSCCAFKLTAKIWRNAFPYRRPLPIASADERARTRYHRRVQDGQESHKSTAESSRWIATVFDDAGGLISDRTAPENHVRVSPRRAALSQCVTQPCPIKFRQRFGLTTLPKPKIARQPGKRIKQGRTPRPRREARPCPYQCKNRGLSFRRCAQLYGFKSSDLSYLGCPRRRRRRAAGARHRKLTTHGRRLCGTRAAWPGAASSPSYQWRHAVVWTLETVGAVCASSLGPIHARVRPVPDPDLVVVEGRAAIGRDRVGAGEGVDAAPVGIGARSARSIPRSARRGARRRTGARAGAPRRARCRARPRRRRRCRAAPRRRDGSSPPAGRPPCAREVGVSLKVELRKPRAGEVASRNGCAASASSITAQWSGSAGIAATGPACQGCGTARSASPA